MQKLRSIHLYLGCIFAPLLLFFAISGIWQTLGFANSSLLQALSTIHTARHLKSGGTFLNSPILILFILLMALSFIVSTILGVVLALKHGRNRRAALYCLALGVIIPLGVVLLKLGIS